MKKIVNKKYTVPVVATDVVIFTLINSKLHVLLIQMKRDHYLGMWAAPGGLVQKDESLDAASMRHVVDKTGIKKLHIEQLYTFGDPERDPFGRVVSVAYMALLPSDKVSVYTTEEYSAIRWFPVSDMPRLAYDHANIIQKAQNRLISKLAYSNIAYGLLPKQFPLSQLREVYEIILGKKIDKRNFSKKIFTLDIVKETGKYQEGAAHRPSKLYTFKKKKYQICDIL